MRRVSSQNSFFNSKTHRIIFYIGICVVTAVICSVIGMSILYQQSSSIVNVKVMNACTPTFTGMDGFGTMSLSCSSSYESVDDSQRDQEIQSFLSTITFKAENGSSTHLKNGETVVVNAVVDEEKAKQLDLKLSDLQKSFTVDGLSSGLTAWDDLDETNQDKLNTLAAKALDSAVTSGNTSKSAQVIDRAQLLERYLDYSDSTGESAQMIYFVKAVVTSKTATGSPQQTTEYYVITVSPIAVSTDGSVSLTKTKATAQKYETSSTNDTDVLNVFNNEYSTSKMVDVL